MRRKPGGGTLTSGSTVESTKTWLASALRPVTTMATPRRALRCAERDGSARATTCPARLSASQRTSGINLWVGGEIGPHRPAAFTAGVAGMARDRPWAAAGRRDGGGLALRDTRVAVDVLRQNTTGTEAPH